MKLKRSRFSLCDTELLQYRVDALRESIPKAQADLAKMRAEIRKRRKAAK